MDEFYRAIQSLPGWLAEPLMQLPENTVPAIHELRFRTGCGIVVTIQGRQCPIGERPECPAFFKSLLLTQKQLEDIFFTLCGNSVHTHQLELEQGYFTTATGCRVGVAGRYTRLDNGKAVLQKVEGLNYRIARAACVELPPGLCELLHGRFTGVAVVGEPDSGKTTILRQMSVFVAGLGRTVTVIDERNEFFGTEEKNPVLLDRLAGLPKAEAVQMALRTLAPQVIVLDELGSMDEVMALEQGFFSGVDFIISIHASNSKEALQRPQIRYLKERGMIHTMILLQGRCAPGCIQEVVTV